jgi:poly(3-hydroxyalkanoate) depolymerase
VNPGSADVNEPDIRTLRVAGQEVRVALHGRDTARRTLLVFNGIGASLETVAPFAAHFRDTRVVTFDVPGVGGSPAPALPYRFSWLARLAARLLDALGIDEVDVFGVSWGGALAQQFAHDHPARSRSLTLAATCAGFVMAPGDPRVLLRLATPRRYADPAYMLEVGPDIYGGQLRHDRALLAEHAEAMRAVGRRGYLYQLLAGVGWTSWLWLPRLHLPALILMGADDPIVPTVNGRIIASRLPDARLEIVGCGHLFILTDPAGTAARIEGFIRGDRDRPTPPPTPGRPLLHTQTPRQIP